jgi:hypothetical protein
MKQGREFQVAAEERRLSDLIIVALDKALQQHDLPVCEALQRALELALTRTTIDEERRSASDRILQAYARLESLRAEMGLKSKV